MKPVLILKNVSKTFDQGGREELTALKDINLEIEEGEFFVFVGPSGCGKSTLLRIMSGLEKAYHGKMTLGEGVRREDFSFVFQQFALLPWLTVYENIEIGLIARQIPENLRRKKIEETLKLLRLEKSHKLKPKELSGGMRQRVGIARALVTDPKIIFMDEPFSELDSFTAEELRKELLSIWQGKRPTIVMVTHIIEEAVELADRIAVLTARPGRIEKIIENNLPRPRVKRSDYFFKLEDDIHRVIKP